MPRSISMQFSGSDGGSSNRTNINRTTPAAAAAATPHAHAQQPQHQQTHILLYSTMNDMFYKHTQGIGCSSCGGKRNT